MLAHRSLTLESKQWGDAAQHWLRDVHFEEEGGEGGRGEMDGVEHKSENTEGSIRRTVWTKPILKQNDVPEINTAQCLRRYTFILHHLGSWTHNLRQQGQAMRNHRQLHTMTQSLGLHVKADFGNDVRNFWKCVFFCQVTSTFCHSWTMEMYLQRMCSGRLQRNIFYALWPQFSIIQNCGWMFCGGQFEDALQRVWRLLSKISGRRSVYIVSQCLRKTEWWTS